MGENVFNQILEVRRKRHKCYDLSSYSNNIPYNILTWDEVLANRLSGFILSWYLWYIFGCFKNICLHSKQTWSIKLNENNLWGCQNSWFRVLCSFMDLIPFSFLSTKSALFRHLSQVSQKWILNQTYRFTSVNTWFLVDLLVICSIVSYLYQSSLCIFTGSTLYWNYCSK